MADTKWSEEIEEALSQVVTKPRRQPTPTLPRVEQPRPSPVVVVKRPKFKPPNENTSFTLVLFFVFLALAVGLAFTIRYKNAISLPVYPNVNNMVPDETPEPPPQPPASPAPDTQLRNEVKALSHLTDKIWERVKQNSDRLAIAGTLLNNNFLVDSRNISRTSYIYINKDWTIDKMPDQLSLDAEDREFLSRHLRHGESDAIRDKE